MESVKKQSGRPKKSKYEKIKYQRIAVHTQDYQKLVQVTESRGIRITDAFEEMVKLFCKKLTK